MEQITLDMIPNGYTPIAHVSQYDNGRHIRFNLRNIILDGSESVLMKIRKSDGNSVSKTIENHTSYLEYVSEMADCDVAGTANCEIVISKDNAVLGSKNFRMNIEADAYDGAGVVTETASGRIATFETNMVDVLQEVKCEINPIQNGTPWIDSNEVNKEPYIKRAVAGTASRIGNHLYDKLIGGSFAWNQNIKNGNFADGTTSWETDSVSISVSSGILTIVNSGTDGGNCKQRNIAFASGHKYLLGSGIASDNLSFCHSMIYDGVNSIYLENKNLTSSIKRFHHIFTVTNSSTIGQVQLYRKTSTETAGSVKYNNVNLIDLTQMLGSTIADYIYSLEQATAGAGVAFFRTLFPNDYYAYNAGELMSVKATAHIMRNASNTVIGNYPLDANLELRGIPQIDENGNLSYDGDEYTSDGNVLRKYGIVDLGTLTWNYTADNQFFVTYNITNGKPTNNSTIPHALIAGYVVGAWNDVATDTSKNKMFCMLQGQYNQIRIRDISAGTDATAFKNSLSGVYIIYELATATTEQATPFTNPQVCDENGTEEYTDSRSVAIPVGHETYQANICEIIGIDELNIKQSGQDMSEIARLIKLEFDDTVYLAEVSCLNGVWKLKLLGAEVDLGDLTWRKWNTTGVHWRFAAPLADAKYADTTQSIPDILCTDYEPSTPSATYAGTQGITLGHNVHECLVCDERYSDAVSFKSAMSGVKLVYPLATPTEITLDETEQFEALLGVNNVWHDGNGDTEVKYLFDA